MKKTLNVKKTKIGQVYKKKYRRFIPFYFMMLPAVIYLIINNYIPMFGVMLAFKKFDFQAGFFGSQWIGFSNFTYLFKTNDAFIITRNTLLYNTAFIILGTILPVMVAIFLNEIKPVRLRKFYQTSILFPHLISMIVVSYVVYAFLNTNDGFINQTILNSLGLDPISWYTTSKYWPVILVIVHLWKSFGYYTIIYYATLVGVDKGYYEAAVLDGATTWQQVKFITLPFLKSTIITLTLLSIGRIFYSDFGLFYQVPMNSGPLIDVTNTIDTYVYRGLFELNDIGKASAAGFYQSIVGFILIMTANTVIRKISPDDALF